MLQTLQQLHHHQQYQHYGESPIRSLLVYSPSDVPSLCPLLPSAPQMNRREVADELQLNEKNKKILKAPLFINVSHPFHPFINVTSPSTPQTVTEPVEAQQNPMLLCSTPTTCDVHYPQQPQFCSYSTHRQIVIEAAESQPSVYRQLPTTPASSPVSASPIPAVPTSTGSINMSLSPLSVGSTTSPVAEIVHSPMNIPNNPLSPLTSVNSTKATIGHLIELPTVPPSPQQQFRNVISSATTGITNLNDPPSYPSPPLLPEPRKHIDESNAGIPSLPEVLASISMVIHVQMVRDAVLPLNRRQLLSDFTEDARISTHVPSPPQLPADSTTCPTVRSVYAFLLYVFQRGRFSSEIAIITLVYLHRAMAYSQVALSQFNYRPLFMATLCIAQKMFDDTPLCNSDFRILYPQLIGLEHHQQQLPQSNTATITTTTTTTTTKSLFLKKFNSLESRMCQIIQWHLFVNNETFALYVHELKGIWKEYEQGASILPAEPEINHQPRKHDSHDINSAVTTNSIAGKVMLAKCIPQVNPCPSTHLPAVDVESSPASSPLSINTMGQSAIGNNSPFAVAADCDKASIVHRPEPGSRRKLSLPTLTVSKQYTDDQSPDFYGLKHSSIHQYRHHPYLHPSQQLSQQSADSLKRSTRHRRQHSYNPIFVNNNNQQQQKQQQHQYYYSATDSNESWPSPILQTGMTA